MALSFLQTASLTCPQCKTPFDAEIWLIIDAGERPDLAARCHDGSIHIVTCPNGHSGMLPAPLLFHDRAKQQLFLAYPQRMTQEQVQQMGEQLIQQLRGQMLILSGSNYLDAPQAIPIELLPAAMDDKLDEAMAHLQQQAAEQAEALQRDPRISAALRVLREHPPLVETLQQWMNLDAWNDSKQFLETHPELVTNDAELVLAAMDDLARAQEHADAQKTLVEHREIVRVARENGIDAAFEKYLARSASDGRGAGAAREPDARAELQARLAELNIHSQEELERALPDHPELQELLARVMRDENPILQAIEKLMETRSPQEATQIARAYPILLSDEGINVVREMVSNAHTKGAEDTANGLQQRLLVLEQIRESGIPVDEFLRQLTLAEALDEESSGPSVTPTNIYGEIPEEVQPLLKELDQLTHLSTIQRKIDLYQTAIDRVSREQNPVLWGVLHGNLAHALGENPRGNRAQNLELAIKHNNLALEIFTLKTNPSLWATIQNNLALIYLDRITGDRAGNIEEAIHLYELALQVRKRETFPENWAETQNNLGLAYVDRIRGNHAENLEEAIRHYEQALEVETRETSPKVWADIQMNLANACSIRIRGNHAENLEEAIRHYEQALEVETRESYPEDWATIQMNLSNAYSGRIRGNRADNMEEAIGHCKLALEIKTRESFPEDWARIQFNLATKFLYRINGNRADNLEEAIRHCELALQVRTREAFPIDWATSQVTLAAINDRRIYGDRADNLEEAIRHCELALQVQTRDAFPADWAATQLNLGEVYRERIRGGRAQNLEEAIRHYDLALQVFTAEEFPERWASAQNNLAIAYRNRVRGEPAENLEAAIRHYELALQVRTRETFPKDWASTNLNLGIAYNNRIRGDRQENQEKAIYHSLLSLQFYTRNEFPEEWAASQNNLGILYMERIEGNREQNLQKATDHLKESLLEFNLQRDPQRILSTANNLGVLYGKQNDWLTAHQTFAVAREAAESIFSSSVTFTGQRSQMLQLAALYDQDLAVCVQLNLHDPNIAREALAESEAARSRAFLRQLGMGDFAPPAAIPAPLAAQEKNILAQLRETENNLAGVDTRSDRMSEMERTLTDRRKQLVDRLDFVWNDMLAASPDAAGYISLRRGDTPTWNDLAALAALVGNDTVLVEFHSLDDQTLAFVWRKHWDAPKMLALPLTRERLLCRYLLPYEREVLNTYRREQAHAAERELYHDWLELGEELLAPLEPLLGDASLVYFIPHQLLHLLPLHALKVNGEPFIKRRAVAYAPSAAVLKRVLTKDEVRTTKDEDGALVMGYTHAPWQRDVFVGEALEVAKLFGADAIADNDATRAALQERAPAASIIHLSCHAAFDRDDALNSAVALADGVFTAREWMRLNLRADLVTLSACQLAFNAVNPGDDLVGMTRAILYAGASSVLLALWSVYADTTLEWMLDFYQRIQSHNTPQAKAHAFRDATLALRAKHDDPYVWAPFVLVGDALKVAR